MIITLDTSTAKFAEMRALQNFLSILLSYTDAPGPALEPCYDLPDAPVPQQTEPVGMASVPASEAPSAIGNPTGELGKRTRRTKAEMAAAEAAGQKADSTPTPTAEGAATAQPTVTDATPESSVPKTLSIDEFRALLNEYIQKHSMEEAIGQLKAFGCNRVTEALALEPAKLSQLAAALRG